MTHNSKKQNGQTPNIEDVAREADVSIATVSLARWRANRAQFACRDHADYQSDYFRYPEPVFYVRCAGRGRYCPSHGFSVLLCNTDEDPQKEAFYIELMMAERVAGVVLSPTSSSGAPYSGLLNARTPVVVIDRRLDDVDVDTVVVEGYPASKQVVSHLIEMGHRRIGTVVGTSNVSSNLDRYDGYACALTEAGIPIDPALVRKGIPKTRTGYEKTTELLSLADPPTALFTGNNLLTIGALRAIHERNLSMPDDIAIAAFDEMDWMFVMNPPLTAVAQPMYEMGGAGSESASTTHSGI